MRKLDEKDRCKIAEEIKSWAVTQNYDIEYVGVDAIMTVIQCLWDLGYILTRGKEGFNEEA